MLEITDVNSVDRVTVKNVSGRRIWWVIDEDGEAVLKVTKLRADILEVPRFTVPPGMTIDTVVRDMIEGAGEDVEVLKVVHWPTGEFPGHEPLPEQYGLILANVERSGHNF